MSASFGLRGGITPQRETDTPKETGVVLHGRERRWPRLMQRHQLLHHSGSEMPSGYPVSGSTEAFGRWRSALLEGRDRGLDQRGESRAFESWWVSGVLVDNKLVAEIGERHLVRCGSSSSKRKQRGRRHELSEPEQASHHRDRRGAQTGGKGAPAVRSVPQKECGSMATLCREIGIRPIEGIPRREVVSLNR